MEISTPRLQTAIDAPQVLRKLSAMRDTILTILGLTALSGMIAGCGNSSSLSTGSVLGGTQTAAAPAPKPISPSERALYVSATVARAQRCGFYFEPEQVKSSYLAAEAQAGTPPDLVQKVTKEYDFTRQSVLSSVAKDDGYCTEGRTREVKAALNRQLAGDFNPPQKRQEVNISVFDHQSKGKAFDGNEIFDKAGKPQRRMGDD